VTQREIRDITGWIHDGMWSYFPESGYPGARIEQLSHPGALWAAHRLSAQDPGRLRHSVPGSYLP